MLQIDKKINELTADKNIFNRYYNKVLARTELNINYFRDSYGHVSTGNKYSREKNIHWTASFFVGMTQLAYLATNDRKYCSYNKQYLDSFVKRLSTTRLDHDLGFLYTLSCVAIYKNTGNEEAKSVAVSAADELIKRFNNKGNYIQAWKPMGVGMGDVKIIIDCMLNLPLLYWATEETGDTKYAEIARKHAMTTSKTLLRSDYSVYHTYLFDPVSGRAIMGKTHQGKYDESTWARGQAWALYGFALSYIYTGDRHFLECAKGAAAYYINNLPNDYVCYWDFSATDLTPEMKDSSAAAIGASGLLLLSHLDVELGELYKQYGKIILMNLTKHYYIDTQEEGIGLLREGYYRSQDYNECTIWGDYFYMEALYRIMNGDKNKMIFW